MYGLDLTGVRGRIGIGQDQRDLILKYHAREVSQIMQDAFILSLT
jgi:hypothetical protein